MALIDKILGRSRSLSDLPAAELRKEEILIGKQRDRLLKKIEDLAGQKQKIFNLGATQKSPELRKALAQDFELKSQEQLMSARELNLRSKELMTVARLRLVKEGNEKGRALGRLKLTDRDVARISGWIEDDTVSQDLYNERLDSILSLGEEADRDAVAAAGLTQAGQELMHAWDELDRGTIKEGEAFDRVEDAMRRRQSEKGI
jgi:Asp-tRNA(Asn)/Glu-tRNA(Gln) amidotransferase B subunit